MATATPGLTANLSVYSIQYMHIHVLRNTHTRCALYRSATATDAHLRNPLPHTGNIPRHGEVPDASDLKHVLLHDVDVKHDVLYALTG